MNNRGWRWTDGRGMRLSAVAAALLASTWLPASAVAAEDDADRDAAIFGTTGDAAGGAATGAPGASDGPGGARDDLIFGPADAGAPAEGQGSADLEARLAAKLQERDDYLAVGGQAYLRGDLLTTDSGALSEQRLSTPMLYDVYLDARPNERTRAYARGRLRHTPSLTGGGSAADGFGVGSGGQGGRRTTALLDQLWLKLDVGRRLYVTVGRQPIRWGSGRFWNPTDVVNVERRDPLAIFDERTGVEMLKLHWPIESLGWNFYGVATYGGAGRPADVGLALRAEVLFSTVEVALSAARIPGHAVDLDLDALASPQALAEDPTAVLTTVRQRPWLLGADVSAGVWLLDLRAEVGLQRGIEQVFIAQTADGQLSPFYRRDKWLLQSTLGVETAIRYSDEDNVILGAEYFYNQRGANNPMPMLMFAGLAAPLHMARHYGAAYAVLMAPGTWNDTTFTASWMRSFSDGSALARLDYQVRALTYLSVNVYGTYHFGSKGELRLSYDLPASSQVLLGASGAALGLPRGTQAVDVGVALRLSL